MKLVMEFNNLELVSVNDMYRPTVSKADKNGKRHAFLRSSYELMSFQDKIDPMLEELIPKMKEFISQCTSEYKYLGFEVLFLIGMPKEVLFYKRNPDDLRPHDASNYIKAPEDRIAHALEIDDKYSMDIRAVKYLSDNDKWKLTVIMKPVDYKKYTENYVKEVFLNEK